MVSRSTLIPCLRYADAPAAIEFLCRAFGFKRHAVYTDPDHPHIVVHAELTLGDGMVMLSSAKADSAQQLYRFKTPAEAGGITVCVCAVIADPDAHYAQALAAGAEIVRPLGDNHGYPGRSYNARDPEGNNWDFGSYDPWGTPGAENPV